MILRKFRYFSLFLILCVNYAFAFNLTNAGDPSVAYMNAWQAHALGKRSEKDFIKAGLVLNDPIAENFLETLGKKLVAHSPSPKDPVHFFIVKSDDLNAFTGPGGYIGVDTGIIEFVKNEAQLAAVMSHETGHVVQKHLPRMLAEKDELAKPTVAAALASVAIGILNPAAGAIALTSSVADYQQHIINYTINDEKEADRIGMGILYHSGFNPMAMPHLFSELLKASELYPKIPKMLRTHPTDTFRIADSLNRALLYPKRHYKVHPYFYLIQARIKAETSHDSLLLLHEFMAQARSEKPYIKTAGLYGYALMETKLGHFNLAQQALNTLLKQHPKQILFHLAEANLDLHYRHFAKAFNDLKSTYKTNPQNDPVAYAQAVTAYEARHYKVAINLLEDLQFEQPKNLGVLYYLAQSQAHAGEKQMALMTQAKLLIKTNQRRAARALLLRALNMHGKNPYARIQIEARLKNNGLYRT